MIAQAAGVSLCRGAPLVEEEVPPLELLPLELAVATWGSSPVHARRPTRPKAVTPASASRRRRNETLSGSSYTD
jgi:hypothetical protein